MRATWIYARVLTRVLLLGYARATMTHVFTMGYVQLTGASKSNGLLVFIDTCMDDGLRALLDARVPFVFSLSCGTCFWDGFTRRRVMHASTLDYAVILTHT